MDPRLNDNELAWRSRAREAAAGLAAAAASIDADDATPRDLLAGLGAAGMLGVCVPEAHGGGGGGLVEAALVCEEMGAASAGAAAIVVAHLAAASLVEACADDDDGRDLLAALACGDKLAAVTLDGAVSLLQEPAVSIAAAAADDGVKLDGRARAVAGALTADVLVVPATSDDGGVVLAVIAADAAGVTVEASERKLGLNGSAMGAVSFSGAAGRVLGGGDAAAALAAAADLARVAHAALCVGIGRAAQEAGTRYVTASEDGLDRSQSVQWMIADLATETEAARLLTWYAASRSDALELREAAAMARLVAADAAVGAGRSAVQIMGPAGNRSSAGVERLYRDAKAMEVHCGAVDAQRAAVARRLLPDLFEDAPAG